MRYQNHRMNNQGFSLLEILIAVIILGVMSKMMSPMFSTLITSQKGSYNEKQKVVNQQINNALINYARTSTTGALPTPYTGAGRTNAIYDPLSSTSPGLALIAALNQSSVNPSEINEDGYSSRRVRVYQLVTGLTQTVPLYFQSGPSVTLTYQYGAIYQTACPFATTSCNPTSASGVPGASPKMTSSNYSTWNVTGTDSAPVFVSSLALQKQMLMLTSQRLDKIRDAFVGYLNTQQRQAAATDTTNFYPTGLMSLAGATPSTNQGCRDGWYNLAAASLVLSTVGLTTSEFGSTAWGGIVQYCRDYDANGTQSPNAVPHYGAIRIHKNVSSGAAPDSSVTTNNIVLTF